MLLHAIIAVAVSFTSAIAGSIPFKRLEVPQPNPLPLTIDPIPDFELVNFEAQAVALSNRNYISFHLTPFPGATPFHCYALGTSFTHRLTTIPQTYCYPGKDPSPPTATPTPTTTPIPFPFNSNFTSPSPSPSTPPFTNKTAKDTNGEHVWFSWTMGEDVDPATDPTADGVFDMGKPTGAYLKVVRQVNGLTRDEAVRHVRAPLLPVVEEGTLLEHQAFAGAGNFSLVALRFGEVAH